MGKETITTTIKENTRGREWRSWYVITVYGKKDEAYGLSKSFANRNNY